MSWLAEDLNEKDCLRESYLFLETERKLSCWNGSLPAFSGIYYTSTALQEDDIPENQANVYSREGTLSSKLTKWVKTPGAFDGRGILL